MFNWVGAGLDFVKSELEFDYKKDAAKATRKADIGEAEMVLDNAKARLAAGQRKAGFQRHQSKVIQSDAAAAMVGQGTGVDIMDMAQLKSRADYNAIATLFDARSEAADMRVRSARMKRDAQQRYKLSMEAADVGKFGDRANIVGDIFGSFF